MKKYYWLKMNNNFFDREEIKIIESQTNGPTYVLLYVKLLLKSLQTDGTLRLNSLIPYDESMLAVITNTNVDIVRSALKAFSALGLLEIMDDKTIYLNEVKAMLGVETSEAVRKRNYRKGLKNTNNGTLSLNCPIEIEKDLEKELEIELEIEKNNNPQNKQRGVTQVKKIVFPTSDLLFNSFWEKYPKKTGLAKAFKSFKSLDVDDELLENMLQAVEIQQSSNQWQKEKGRFIPDASNWLDNQRWNDALSDAFTPIEISPDVDAALDDLYRNLR